MSSQVSSKILALFTYILSMVHSPFNARLNNSIKQQLNLFFQVHTCGDRNCRAPKVLRIKVKFTVAW